MVPSPYSLAETPHAGITIVNDFAFSAVLTEGQQTPVHASNSGQGNNALGNVCGTTFPRGKTKNRVGPSALAWMLFKREEHIQ